MFLKKFQRLKPKSGVIEPFLSHIITVRMDILMSVGKKNIGVSLKKKKIGLPKKISPVYQKNIGLTGGAYHFVSFQNH